jgi:hypothetical protein
MAREGSDVCAQGCPLASLAFGDKSLAEPR